MRGELGLTGGYSSTSIVNLQFGRELSLPRAAKLDPAQLLTGSTRAWLSRSPDGLLVLKA